MVDITIVNECYFMVYKPTYNWGGHPLLVLNVGNRWEWGVAGIIITSDYGSFPYSLLSTSKSKSNAYLVGGLEPWNFMIFHSVGNVIIPTDFNSIIFQRGRSATNQIYVILIWLIIDYHSFTIDLP